MLLHKAWKCATKPQRTQCIRHGLLLLRYEQVLSFTTKQQVYICSSVLNVRRSKVFVIQIWLPSMNTSLLRQIIKNSLYYICYYIYMTCIWPVFCYYIYMYVFKRYSVIIIFISSCIWPVIRLLQYVIIFDLFCIC